MNLHLPGEPEGEGEYRKRSIASWPEVTLEER